MELSAQKSAARKAAFSRRKLAFDQLGATPASPLAEVLRPHSDKVLAAYMPMRSEISPLEQMRNHRAAVAVPIIQAKGEALKFARWTSDMEMVAGAFGAEIPKLLEYVVPEVVIVPLVAFDAEGNRLGYGGGFYDRTLEGLRAQGPVLAIGFAYEAQFCAQLPIEATDQPLDFIVTEQQIRDFAL
jgi:5-formyltetrahydrofolate cyclo-ligase